jgi:aspartate/glutamate racemase
MSLFLFSRKIEKMKTIGLVGGTGWISSAEYYRIINEEINRRSGGLQFARCILYSINYAEIDAFNKQNNKEGVYELILDATKKLAASGADFIILCANTLHQFVARLEQEIDLPIIHIAEATANDISRKNMSKVGLLGTKQTMEMDFYRSRLKEKEIDTVIPELSARDSFREQYQMSCSRVFFTMIPDFVLLKYAESSIKEVQRVSFLDAPKSRCSSDRKILISPSLTPLQFTLWQPLILH